MQCLQTLILPQSVANVIIIKLKQLIYRQKKLSKRETAGRLENTVPNPIIKNLNKQLDSLKDLQQTNEISFEDYYVKSKDLIDNTEKEQQIIRKKNRICSIPIFMFMTVIFSLTFGALADGVLDNIREGDHENHLPPIKNKGLKCVLLTLAATSLFIDFCNATVK